MIFGNNSKSFWSTSNFLQILILLIKSFHLSYYRALCAENNRGAIWPPPPCKGGKTRFQKHVRIRINIASFVNGKKAWLLHLKILRSIFPCNSTKIFSFIYLFLRLKTRNMIIQSSKKQDYPRYSLRNRQSRRDVIFSFAVIFNKCVKFV